MIKKLAILFIVIVVAVIGIAIFAKSEVNDYLGQKVHAQADRLVTIKHGSSLRSALWQMENKGAIEGTSFVRLLPYLHPELVNIKAGTYQVPDQASLKNLLKEMVAGNEFQYTITFIEGSRFSEWRTQLSLAEGIQHKTQEMTEVEIAKAVGIDKDRLEGLLLAETYHYTASMSDLDILKRSHHALMRVLNQAWETRQQGLPLKTPYEALTLASIIEKETAVEPERERIASVFVNRLNKNMRLQTDPTVIYGLGDKYDGNIRKKDLLTPTAYNTYVINGLPPTPIAMPGAKSIRAALNPENTRYLYFVASGDGGHVFTKSLSEHNRAVRNYLRKLRAK